MVTPAARHADIADTVGAIAWEMDAATLTMTYVSNSVVQVFGYPAERWLESTFLDQVLQPDDRTRGLHVMLAARDGRSGFEIYARVTAADGSIRLVNTVAQFIPG